jgi:hypothetical protein
LIPEQLAESKLQEMRKKAVAIIERQAADEAEKRVISEKIKKP